MPAFVQLPPTIRVPGVYVEHDPSALGGGPGADRPSLIIAQRTSAASIAANTRRRITSAAQAAEEMGPGSIAHLMAAAYLEQGTLVPLYVIGIADAGGATARQCTITVTGPATEAGTIALYVGARRLAIGVANGASANTIAASIEAALDDDVDALPYTAAVATNVVTLTAKNGGTVANGIAIAVNARGQAAGEKTPAGVGLTIAQTVAGATDPTITTAITNLGDIEHDFIALGFHDATARTALLAEIDRRWGALVQVYGHVWDAHQASVGTLEALAYESRYLTVYGYEAANQTPFVVVAAAAMGVASAALTADPARPLRSLRLRGVLATPEASRFTATERNSLLGSGIATLVHTGDVLRVERATTTATKNVLGETDAQYLDVTTPYTSAALWRGIRARLGARYARHKIASDGTRIPAGEPIVTPSILRAEAIAYMREQEGRLVENLDAAIAHLTVERSADDPTRVDMLFPPDLINGLHVLAVLAQPRLEYAAA